MGFNPLNWARRRLFNKKALRAAPDATRLLKAEAPWQAPNRGGRRDWLFHTPAGKATQNSWLVRRIAALRRSHPDYPILAHCFIGKCRRLPRYNGRCYTHIYENIP
jgi:hypothetical protein